MLSGWFKLFTGKKDSSGNQGPVSFYKFKYDNNVIILIGDRHGKISAELEKQYYSMFYQFAVQNENTKFLVERNDTGAPQEFYSDIGFIDCMLNLSLTGDVDVIKADKRCLPKGLDEFYSFLHNISEVILNWKKECEKRNVKPGEIDFIILSIINDERVIRELYKLSESESDFTLSDWYKFIESENKYIKELITRYLGKNKILEEFLASCLLRLSTILAATNDQYNDYCALGFNRESALTRSIANICVDKITKDGDKSLFLSSELIYYLENYLDATMACDIWDELQSDQDLKKTTIVVTGAKHTANLAGLLGLICDTIVAYQDGEKIISPKVMHELLHDDFQLEHDLKCMKI